MRTLHELYCILWERIKDRDLILSVCWEIARLGQLDKITLYEWDALRNHFESQKPSETRHSEFTKRPNWGGGTYWWNEKGTSERKRFVQLMMELTK